MKTMLVFFLCMLGSFVLISCSAGYQLANSAPPCSMAAGVAGDGRLDQIVDCIRTEHQLPALAAILIHDGVTIEQSAMGKRSAWANVAVSIDDQWHIGSITKSMTSTVAALLVKDGLIRWDSTLSDIFPELVGSMRPEYQTVRLDELLAHMSGLPSDNDIDNSMFEDFYTDSRSVSMQRYALVELAVTLDSSTKRGEFTYNNVGYITAGALLERASGMSWETLLQRYLFSASAMNQAGFGPPDTHGDLDQPIGHTKLLGFWYPVDPASEDIADLPSIFGPAGLVHVSLADMATYLGLHLRGLRGESIPGLLSGEEFAKLHTPVANANMAGGWHYALGWSRKEDVIQHDGSNSLWMAIAMINAKNNTALFIVTNAVENIKDPDSKTSKAIKQLYDVITTRANIAFSPETRTNSKL